MDAASKYRFVERSDGFIVEGPQRMPVRVDLLDTGFRVQLHLPRQLSLFPELDSAETTRNLPDTNLVQYRNLVDLVVAGVMSRWKPTKLKAPPWIIETWAKAQTCKALKCRIYEQWKRLTAKADPDIFGVQKAVFAVSLRDADLLHEKALYEDRFLVSDIRKYRAAASIVPIARELVTSQLEQSDFAAEEIVDNEDAGESPASDIPDNEDWDDEERCSLDSVLQRLSDWQGLYSPTGVPYRSLSRTLMQLPGGIPCQLLYELHHLHLVRPMTTRLELACLLLSSSEARGDARRAPRHQQLFHHATQSQIREGMAKVSVELENQLSHRRTNDVGRFVRYLLDYPEEHRGTFAGLVRDAIQWHRTHGWREDESFEVSYDDSTSTMEPPIPLPELDGVHFLRTVGEVHSEGRRMRHCVGSYADQAVLGECFLFHVEFDGECATVEISRSGRLRQACGPINQTNKATAYAEQILKHWGSRLAGPKPRKLCRSSAETDVVGRRA